MCRDWPPLKHRIRPQTSGAALVWVRLQTVNKGSGTYINSKWALRSFYCEHHSHTYLSTLTNMRTHSLRGSVSRPRTHTGGSRLKPPTFPLVDEPICSISTAAENRNISVKYRFHYLNSYLFYFYWSYFKWYWDVDFVTILTFLIDLFMTIFSFCVTGYIYLFLAAVDKDLSTFGSDKVNLHIVFGCVHLFIRVLM